MVVVSVKPVGKSFEAFLTPSNDDKVIAVASQALGERLSDPG